jgi:pilus assembly protein CpaF
MIEAEAQTTPLSLFERENLIIDVLDELFGLGPLEALLKDRDISDILVNKHDQVFIERNGMLEETGIVFKDDPAPDADHRADRQLRGPRIDESSPMVDARLADGSRVNAIIRPSPRLARALDTPLQDGPPGRFRSGGAPVDDPADARLRERGRPQPAQYHRVGGTGAGKTTLLNILSSFISDKERIVTIEDAAELMLRQRHVVRLETRPANIEGRGAVKARDLVMNALRMRPDRIVVGEVRGAEALDMLQAMNTGHDGSLTTIHANSPRDALYRLDTMVAMANLNIPDRAVRQQVASAVDILVQVTRQADGTRKITAVSEITGMEGEVITMQDIFLFEKTGLGGGGPCPRGRFRAIRASVPKCSDRLAAGRQPLADGYVRPPPQPRWWP